VAPIGARSTGRPAVRRGCRHQMDSRRTISNSTESSLVAPPSLRRRLSRPLRLSSVSRQHPVDLLLCDQPVFEFFSRTRLTVLRSEVSSFADHFLAAGCISHWGTRHSVYCRSVHMKPLVGFMGAHPVDKVQARQPSCRLIDCKTTRPSVNTGLLLIVRLLARFATMKLCNDAGQAQRCHFGNNPARPAEVTRSSRAACGGRSSSTMTTGPHCFANWCARVIPSRSRYSSERTT
jgi:hypothetical protein